MRAKVFQSVIFWATIMVINNNERHSAWIRNAQTHRDTQATHI